jgi:hypothetical protein
MNTSAYRKTVLVLALLSALLMPAVLTAQVEEARVRIDGMV